MVPRDAHIMNLWLFLCMLKDTSVGGITILRYWGQEFNLEIFGHAQSYHKNSYMWRRERIRHMLLVLKVEARSQDPQVASRSWKNWIVPRVNRRNKDPLIPSFEPRHGCVDLWPPELRYSKCGLGIQLRSLRMGGRSFIESSPQPQMLEFMAKEQ